MPCDSALLDYPKGQACKRCGVRYQQGGGLCRTCQRIVAAERDDERQLEEAVEREMAALAERPKRELAIDGRVFVVMWDGS